MNEQDAKSGVSGENQSSEQINDIEQDSKLKLVLVDDESDVLKALTRVLRFDYEIESFTEGSIALDYLQSHEAQIIISDMRMPSMDGAEFLSRARELRPDAIRFLLTGYSDMESTIRAVNEGRIYTYLAKPWDNDALKETLSKASELYLLKKEKKALTNELEAKNRDLELLNNSLEEKVKERTYSIQKMNKHLQALLKNRNQTLKDIVSTLLAIIQHRTGLPADHTERIAEISKAVAVRLELGSKEVTQVYLAGLIHEIGLIGDVDSRHDIVTNEEGEQVLRTPPSNPQLGAQIISQIKRFQPLVSIIEHQDENFDGTGKPGHLKNEDIPIGARIIRVVKNYDYFVSCSYNPSRMKPASALSYIRQKSRELYDPNVVKAFESVVDKDLAELEIDACISLDEVKPGMTLKQDLHMPNGAIMLTAGHSLNHSEIEKLRELEKESSVPIAIFV